MIQVRDLVKEFCVQTRGSGLAGAIKGLGKRKKRTLRALDGVCFDIPDGSLVGYIGPNGAGKSTTIKILAGVMRPTSGTVTANGRIPWKNRIAHVSKIGVVFGQKTQLWWDLPVRESFDLVAAMYGMKKNDASESFAELDRALGVEELLDTPVRQLSLGQRMRCELVAALLPRPDLLFLDEPTIGLDAPSKLAVRDFVSKINTSRGVTTILTTHDMDDIEALAERVILIRTGKTLFDGRMNDLKELAKEERTVTVDLEEPPDESWKIPVLPGMKLVSAEGSRIRWSFDPRTKKPADALGDITTRIAAEREIEDITIESEPIERLIARVYGDFGNTLENGERVPEEEVSI